MTDGLSTTSFPRPWRPVAMSPGLAGGLPIRGVTEDAFWRTVVDEARGGFPHLLVEIFAIENGVIQIARCEGWSLGGDSQDAMPLELREIERISMERVINVEATLDDFGGRVVLIGGQERLDLPAALILSYLSDEHDGYGRRPAE